MFLQKCGSLIDWEMKNSARKIVQNIGHTLRSLNAIVAQPKNCPFGVNTTIELKNVRTPSDNYDIQRRMLGLRSVPVLSDSDVTFLKLIVVLTPNGNFLGYAITGFSERCTFL